MLALGAWQTQRLSWKAGEQAYRDARIAAEPIALPAVVEDPAALFYRRVWVEGTFRHAEEMLLAARSHRRQLGFQVITPLARADGTGLLVNRGWVPLERKEPAHRPAGQVEGTVRVEGIVVPGGHDGWFVPDNHPEQRVWFWVDLASLSEAAGLPPQGFILDAGPAPNPGGVPIGGQTVVELRNEHFSYMITWYCLAIGLGVIYWLFMRRGRAGRDAQTTAPR
jgi:surfeit locus 1 family protein